MVIERTFAEALVLLAENLVLALFAAGAGLAAGSLAAPLITNPGAALIGTPGAPPDSDAPAAPAANAGSAGPVQGRIQIATICIPRAGSDDILAAAPNGGAARWRKLRTGHEV